VETRFESDNLGINYQISPWAIPTIFIIFIILNINIPIRIIHTLYKAESRLHAIARIGYIINFKASDPYNWHI